MGTEKQRDDEAHIRWLIQRRNRTQATSLKLLKLISNRDLALDDVQYSAVQELVAVGFSLWRSVFLADKSIEEGSSIKAARKFLATMLADNAINYTQDRATKEWTFSYYTTNAWLHLGLLKKRIAFDFDEKFLPAVPRERWEYLQKNFEVALSVLTKAINNKNKKQGKSPK